MSDKKNAKILKIMLDKSPLTCYNTSTKREEHNNKTVKEIKTMAKEMRIEQIERELWIMEFKDHWDARDWARRNELNAELAKLRAE